MLIVWFMLEKLVKLPTRLLMAVTEAFIDLHTFVLVKLAKATMKWREDEKEAGRQ